MYVPGVLSKYTPQVNASETSSGSPKIRPSHDPAWQLIRPAQLDAPVPLDNMVVLCEDLRGNGAAAGQEGGRPVDPLLIFAVISVSSSLSLYFFSSPVCVCVFFFCHPPRRDSSA